MIDRQTRRDFLRSGSLVVASGFGLPVWSQTARAAEPVCSLETKTFRLGVGSDARVCEFTDKQSNTNLIAGPASFAEVRIAGRTHTASSLRDEHGDLAVGFADTDVRAVLRACAAERHVVIEVISLTGANVEEFTFLNIATKLKAARDEPFAACVLALNLQTNVAELPRPASQLRAVCYPQFGFAGAKGAIVGCPQADLRSALQDAVSSSPDLPHSKLGGPWAWDQPINRGSYLFNFDGVTEQNVDRWIELARSLGLSQIDFHGGQSFRFGDCLPRPDLYPKGVESLKAVIDRLHDAGISAGLHTYAFFIAKTCPWVTPSADERLAHSATFTLSKAIGPQDNSVPVEEPTTKVSTITGFFVRNSVTVRIDQELIIFNGVSADAPFAFTGCQRGAYGTVPAAHSAGTRVFHLKECFGLFAPDPDSTLLAEVAARTAETYNACGFDMIYLDALDGADVLDLHGGGRFAWHYSARFTYEICKRLKRPALMEMSTFFHHLWCVRSRYCAWDHPNRNYKRFVDIHRLDNEDSFRMFLPGELGWWALKNWTGPQVEPTYADDIEYLMTKCLATDTGFALMGIDPNNAKNIPSLPRLGAIIKRYEDLRHSRQVPEAIKARLREPGREFTLLGDRDRGWQFLPVQYSQHRVEDKSGPSCAWHVENQFEPQPLKLRIAALMGAESYDAPGNVVVAEFTTADEFPRRSSQSQVEGDLSIATDVVRCAPSSGRLRASSKNSARNSSWLSIEKPLSSPLDLHDRQALGLWVHGDGQGEVLNIQLRSPEHLAGGIGDHYIPIDFTGWRYFELIEPEGARYADFSWPYGNIYSIYRESVQFNAISSLGLWYNNLPADKEVRCHLSPIKAIPLARTRVVRPTVAIGGRSIVFPVEIESGCYLEFTSRSDCKLYGPQGEFLRDVTPEGEAPQVAHGDNAVTFSCESPAGIRARANVTLITQGVPLTA